MSDSIHSRCASLAYHAIAAKRMDQFYSYVLLLTTRIPIVSLYDYVREKQIDLHQTEAEGRRFVINSCRRARSHAETGLPRETVNTFRKYLPLA